MAKVDAALKAMSQGLGDKPFCAGIHFSLADIAVGCALGYLDFRFPEIDWRREHPNLAKLSDKLARARASSTPCRRLTLSGQATRHPGRRQGGVALKLLALAIGQ